MKLPASHFEESADFRTDLIPIRLDSVGFSLDDNTPIFKGINLSVAQGKLVALTGPAGSGKSKLLRMLAGDAAPTEGKVLIPSHLRFLMVTHQVYVMETTPLQNLFFGDPAALAEASERHRMLWILDKLQMKSTVELAETEIAMLQDLEDSDEAEEGLCGLCGSACENESDEEEEFMRPRDGSKRAIAVHKKLAGWQNSLSFQEKAKLHIARALIMNPEILILEKPLMNLDEAESERVMTVLREYVSNRGVAMPGETRDMRRPRTCFFSAERSTSTLVDAAWEFHDGQCMEISRTPEAKAKTGSISPLKTVLTETCISPCGCEHRSARHSRKEPIGPSCLSLSRL